MKKFMLTVFCLLASLVLVACGGNKPAEEAEYKLGMGFVMNTKASKNATADAAGVAQFDGMVSTIVTDKDGKIVEIRVDAVQNKVAVNADGTFKAPDSYKTKRELGNDYHMHDWGASLDNDGNGVVKEWFEQANAFEGWAKGKTRAEIAAMEGKVLPTTNGHAMSTDKDLVEAGCTIEIDQFRDATLLAFDDEQGMTFKTSKEIKLGVAATSANQPAKNKNAVAAAEGVDAVDGEVHVYVDFAANAVVDGKIAAALNDAIQPSIKFNAKGEITGSNVLKTKRNLKEDYHMSQWGSDNDGNGVVKEWYIQSAAFSNYVVGMTQEEVSNIKTQEMGGHMIATDKALLDAGCSMQITDIIKVVAKAVANAR